MKILLTGASGFLGSRLLQALLDAGHRVVCAGRRRPPVAHTRCEWLKLEFVATPAAVWQSQLQGVDAVVNLVGIFREQGAASFAAVHVRGPRELFDACTAAGVRRVVQVSALGADARADTPFLQSKYEADRHLLGLPLEGCVAQPSLVFGPEGRSAQRLLALASLPLLPLPAGGRQRVQPIHVDDAVEALRELVELPAGRLRGRRIALVGPQPLTLRDYLLALRGALGLPPRVWRLTVPAPLVALAAWLGERRRDALLDRAAWAMLQRGSTADAGPLSALLGRPPRPAAEFIAPAQRAALRQQAQLAWLLPLLRLSLAAVWLATAAVSLGLYPLAQSLDLLARAGVPAALRPAALWGAAALDLVLGVLTLLPLRSRRWLWLLQGGLILFYSAVIAWRLPEFWLHPYGPLTKNLPLLAVLLLLWQLEPRRGRR
jgi:uncharacterized protein YbjT (DUF2867 family)/uncharacterized membrane protein YphA (DoxX/SURF4 family)